MSFWQFFYSAKMVLFNPCMKFKFVLAQKTSFEALWKCHIQKIFLTFSRVRKIQDLGQSKYELRLISKRTHGISKILFIWGSYESLESLESKIRRWPFLGVHNCKTTVRWSSFPHMIKEKLESYQGFILLICSIFYEVWNSTTSC